LPSYEISPCRRQDLAAAATDLFRRRLARRQAGDGFGGFSAAKSASDGQILECTQSIF